MLLPYSYQIQLESNAPSEIIEKYKKYSAFFKHHKAISRLSLKGRFEKDKEILKIILGSYGYFDATTRYVITEDITTKRVNKENDKGLLIFYLILEVKEPFKVNNIFFEGIDEEEKEKINKRIFLKKGEVFKEDDVNNSVSRIIRYFKNHGYPFVHIDKPKLKLSFEDKKVDILISIQKNKKTFFGDVEIKNLKKVKESFVLKKIKFKKGDLYDQRLVDQTRKRLMSSGIIGYVNIRPKSSDSLESPMRVKVYEVPPKTILAEGGYSTAEGFSGKVAWMHKNLRGNGESVEIELALSQIAQRFQIQPTIPHLFGFPTVKGLANFELRRENIQAYEMYSGELGGGIEKELTENLRLNCQIVGNIADVTQKIKTGFKKNELVGEDKKFYDKIISIPFTLKWDHQNDELDPTHGFKFHIRTEPNFFVSREDSSQKPNNPFVFCKLSLAHVLRLYKSRPKGQKLILFNKITAAQIFGMKRDDLIPHKRIYLGGIKNMRAYGEKKVGGKDELDAAGHPLGGISSGMWVCELRFRFKHVWGINLYNELGFVSSDPLLKFNKELLDGTGFTLVYYSPIGPLQFGVTHPWKRRTFLNDKGENVKDSFLQFYVGIGQI